MILVRSQRMRLYPNKAQAEQIQKTLGCTRFVYNALLDRQNKIWQRRRQRLSGGEMQNLVIGMRVYLPWLLEADSQALNYACHQLDMAFKSYSARRAAYPAFRSKHCAEQSYTTSSTTFLLLDYDRRKIRLPRLGWIKVRGMRRIKGSICSATVTWKNGRYFVSIRYKKTVTVKEQPVRESQTLGLDYKSDGLYVDSEGTCAAMPHYFRKSRKELARQQRVLSRRQGSRKGEKKSKRWIRQKKRVDRLQEHTVNQRKDTLNKKSRQIADHWDAVCVESLKLKEMAARGHGRGRSTMDNSYGIFLKMLDYKLAERGKKLIYVDRMYPSSQICYYCGSRNPMAKDLSIRQITCPVCGAVYDRDINAAENIRTEGLRILKRRSAYVIP
jgi:putative transposase